MINSALQCAASAAKFGLAGATFGVPAAFVFTKSHEPLEKMLFIGGVCTVAAMVFGALQHSLNTLTAFGSVGSGLAVLYLKIEHGEPEKNLKVFKYFIPATMVIGGSIGFFTNTALKAILVYSNFLVLLSSLSGAVATLAYLAPWNREFYWDDAAKMGCFAFLGGAAGYALDLTLKAIKP